MKRSWMGSTLVLAVIAVIAVAAVAATPASAAKRTCKAKHSSTIAQNRSVRVYEVAKDDGSTLYGCRKSNGRKYKLDTASDDGFTESDTYDRVRLNGTQVAWVSTLTDQSCKADCPPGFDPTTVRIGVADVKARTSRSVPAEPVGDALVVTTTGAVAWAAGPGAGVTEIHASIRGAEDQVVDTGAIDAASLGVELTIISWTRDGVERFARLR
ncbi:MAG TPA: hypothetical protein VF533_08505 [Solirubrobacteraceae bacterium]|jgi:hypothetical protein